jgi:hypothetical protein
MFDWSCFQPAQCSGGQTSHRERAVFYQPYVYCLNLNGKMFLRWESVRIARENSIHCLLVFLLVSVHFNRTYFLLSTRYLPKAVLVVRPITGELIRKVNKTFGRTGNGWVQACNRKSTSRLICVLDNGSL